MKKIVLKIIFGLEILGFNSIKFISFFRGLPFFLKDFVALKKQMKNNKDFAYGNFYPILIDKFDKSGTMNGHYFHQDLMVASKIFLNNPQRHIDIGSRIDGFVAHVASFRKIEIFDIRPIESKIDNIIFTQADLTLLPDHLKECCDSLSSLHAIEHFGLGRYGDTIDIDGHLKAIDNLHQMLKPNGKFYFSVPIGKQRIEFNAHRVFSIKYLLQILDDKFSMQAFHFVDDKGDLFQNAILSEEAVATNFSCTYGCGIFELIKK
jgi:SAM-dependent methyltransferase